MSEIDPAQAEEAKKRMETVQRDMAGLSNPDKRDEAPASFCEFCPEPLRWEDIEFLVKPVDLEKIRPDTDPELLIQVGACHLWCVANHPGYRLDIQHKRHPIDENRVWRAGKLEMDRLKSLTDRIAEGKIDIDYAVNGKHLTVLQFDGRASVVGSCLTSVASLDEFVLMLETGTVGKEAVADVRDGEPVKWEKVPEDIFRRLHPGDRFWMRENSFRGGLVDAVRLEIAEIEVHDGGGILPRFAFCVMKVHVVTPETNES